MFTRTIGRVGAGAVLAIGLLLATAVPASAVNATGVIIESSSTITIGGTLTTHFGGHSTTNICAPNSIAATPIPVSFNSTGGGTIGASTTGWGDFVAGANTFKARLVIVGGTVTVSNTASQPNVSVTLTIRAEFRTCDSLTALCTTNNVTISSVSAHYPTSNVSLHPQVSERTTVSGTSGHITTAIGCNTIIRSAINSQTATANLLLHAV